MYQKYVKRILDCIVSVLALLFISPVLVVLGLILAIHFRGRVFYVESRPGRVEKLFKIYKFRTMTNAVDQDQVLLPDEKRLTSFGNFLRKSSLDEIPQLINVIRGEMSLVGPRPLRTEYLELYNENQKKRHLVKPGITGWAQVNGRNAISWKDKLNFDVWYVEHLSLKLDFKIMWKTILQIFRTGEVYTNADGTTNKFTGDN